MIDPRSKTSFARPQQQLIELMQLVNFGRIEGLQVRKGLPVLSPPPRVVRKLKVGADDSARPEHALRDFLLRQQVVELLELMARLGDAEVLVIEVRYGLPCSVEFEHRVEGGRRG